MLKDNINEAGYLFSSVSVTTSNLSKIGDYLAEMKLDSSTIITALLHDVVEAQFDHALSELGIPLSVLHSLSVENEVGAEAILLRI